MISNDLNTNFKSTRFIKNDKNWQLDTLQRQLAYAILFIFHGCRVKTGSSKLFDVTAVPMGVKRKGKPESHSFYIAVLSIYRSRT